MMTKKNSNFSIYIQSWRIPVVSTVWLLVFFFIPSWNLLPMLVYIFDFFYFLNSEYGFELKLIFLFKTHTMPKITIEPQNSDIINVSCEAGMSLASRSIRLFMRIIKIIIVVIASTVVFRGFWVEISYNI